MSEVIEDVFTGIYKNIAILSGHSHTEEICRKIPTVTISAVENVKIAEKCRVLL